MMALFAVFACERVEELSQPEKPQETVEKVEMTFSAVIESDQTKTVLGDSEVENVKKVLWQPEDAIGVSMTAVAPGGGYYQNGTDYWITGDYVIPVERFTAKTSTPVSKTEFDGQIAFGTSFHAFYPYTETVTDTSNVFYFDMPSVQKYVNGSFDPDAAPMVATAAYGETFNFQNLYAVLAVNIKGSDYVKSISFSALDEWGSPAVITGRYRAIPSHEEPAMTLHKNPGYSLTLDCGEAVQLDPDVATPFYIILPPGTYNSFTLTISTPAGNKMLKSGNNPLTLERSHIKPTGDLEYVETIEVDLSERGNANCYIVPSVGLYRFDADIVGNGEYGYVQNERFYPATPEINPYSVELLWEDFSGMVTNLTLVDGQVCFQASGKEGNAVVAVKDENQNTLWSWHLWMTDQPQEQYYVNSNGSFTVLDRNLGATRADRGEGEEWRESRGTLYQWGRKDPFRQEVAPKSSNYQRYLDEISDKPDYFVTGQSEWIRSTDRSVYFWSPDQKTIYDPCPIGYRVAVPEIWSGFTVDGNNAEQERMSKINILEPYDNGLNFVIDDKQNTAWYPMSDYLEYWDNGGYAYISRPNNEVRYWSAFDARRLYFKYDSERYTVQHTGYSDSWSYGFPVRCMKDDGHVDLSKPTVKVLTVKDMTNSSATVVAKVTDAGSSEVTERGIILGTTSDINIDSGIYYPVGSGAGEFEYSFTDLQPATRYYVRAYAVNENGESYSEAKSFYTTWEGTAYDLSRNGTANCYIVSPVYAEYMFNASVKGNGKESVGQIASAEVLWETHMNYDYVPLNVRDIIDTVYVDGDNVHFMLPFDAQPGNASIAVKDAYGTILWSWHIWVVDFDPDETKQTLTNGVQMMDRNLGALNVIPGNYQSHGLTYQWGRKDPFMGAIDNGNFVTTAPANAITIESISDVNNNLQFCIQNPAVIVDNCEWNRSSSLWTAEKSIYDPCPDGWRVPDANVWEYQLRDQSYDTYHYIILRDSKSLYPSTGMIDCGSISDLYHIGYYWTLGCQYAQTHRGWEYIQMNYSGAVDIQLSVRCMKEAPKQSGDNEGYDENEDYEW